MHDAMRKTKGLLTRRIAISAVISARSADIRGESYGTERSLYLYLHEYPDHSSAYTLVIDFRVHLLLLEICP